MNIVTFFRRHGLLGVVIFVALAVSACGGNVGTSWPGVTKLDSTQQIAMAYTDRIVLINPANGDPVELLNEDGRVRLDDEGNPRLWEVLGNDLKNSQFYAPPIVEAGDTLLAANFSNHLFEIDVPSARVNNPDGAEVASAIVSHMTLTDDLLFVGYNDRNFAALNRADMSVRWTFETERGVWAQPLLVADTLYVASLDHHLYAVDPETGIERWKLDLEGAVPAAPTYVDGHLYIGSFARKLFDISPDGAILNQYQTEDWVWGTPVVVDNHLYAADLGGWVYALNLGDGFVEVWKETLGPEAAVRPTPIITDTQVIVGSRDNTVYWLSRESGDLLFERQVAGEVLADMLVIDQNEEQDTQNNEEESGGNGGCDDSQCSGR